MASRTLCWNMAKHAPNTPIYYILCMYDYGSLTETANAPPSPDRMKFLKDLNQIKQGWSWTERSKLRSLFLLFCCRAGSPYLSFSFYNFICTYINPTGKTTYLVDLHNGPLFSWMKLTDVMHLDISLKFKKKKFYPCTGMAFFLGSWLWTKLRIRAAEML